MLAFDVQACFNKAVDTELTSDTIIERLGGTSEVARLCDCFPQAVSQWKGIDPKSGKQREIPKPWLKFLKAARPEVFRADWKPGDPLREKERT
jgi:hypothetical protein